MKLSTAIRIGSMTTKQITINMRDGGNGRCAIGAALDALGYNFCGVHLAEATRHFPVINSIVVRPGFDGIEPRKCVMYEAIMTLNDSAGWARELIADWVEGEERKLGLWPESGQNVPQNVPQEVKNESIPVNA